MTTTKTLEFRPNGDVYHADTLLGTIRPSGGWWITDIFILMWAPAGAYTALRTLGIFRTEQEAQAAFDGFEGIQ